ncbi:hypothetical protein MSI_20730 [Treponema sp. JC4]|uniref:hypothetical protein n=1 Tax=Treponema sp. JC4 TaxID=1124982 RepID=UPI00025B0789|nr:hypothetical protein [Treponema sp. JC4]EID84427.1 hypothetical protein MSI_20730 [Treponema sp. JC4]
MDGNFDDYDYILIRPVGNLIDYKIECKHDDIILTINSYEGIENELVSSVASLYSNEIMFENKNYEWRDYIKVTNKTDSFISCSLYGIPKDTEKEVFIGNGIIDPNGKTAIKTIYDGRLKELYSIRFTTDAIIKEYESNSSSHDLNIIVFSCEGGESPLKLKFENDYNKDDIIVDIRGKVKRERDGLYIYSFYADITNKNGKIIKIKFDESSLSYNGNTSLPFIDGQKYITAGNPPSNKIIPNGGTSSFSLFSANQISWTGNNWRISSMGDDVTVVLAIEVDSKTYYWITYAKVNN